MSNSLENPNSVYLVVLLKEEAPEERTRFKKAVEKMPHFRLKDNAYLIYAPSSTADLTAILKEETLGRDELIVCKVADIDLDVDDNKKNNAKDWLRGRL